jgi:hypothetical protein
LDGPGEQRELAGIHCACCGGPYELIRILGRYGRSYKVLVRCPACNTYGIGSAQLTYPPKRFSDTSLPAHQAATPTASASPTTAVSERDVATMREFLRTFDGDFRALWARKGDH